MSSRRVWRVAVITLLLCWLPSRYTQATVRVINGTPVDPGTYKEVVQISSNGAFCTATVVGPRVIITAAHCAITGGTATFSVDGVEYKARMTRSDLYSSKDHDINLGVTSQDIKGVEPAIISGKASTGLGVTILGYGCTDPDGTGGNDGVLRKGDTVITGFSNFDMVSRKADGAALCYGDSGGPTFVTDKGKKALLGINSKGNIKDTNYSTRTDIPESQAFLKSFADKNGVTICGISADCSITPPPPAAPTCTLSASPSTIKVGQNVTLTLLTQGKVTAASIDGKSVTFPNGQLSVTGTTPGTQRPKATVTGPGGTGTCDTTYFVDNNPPPPTAPTCTLTATPSAIKLGESLTLEIATQGDVTSANIEGTLVPFPSGKRIITPSTKGAFTAKADVSGSGGTSSCFANYTVDDSITPPPPGAPNFAAVPSYCGENTLMQTPVYKVCLGVVKKDSTLNDLRLTDVLIVTYRDTTQEVMPIIARKPRAKTNGDLRIQEDLTTYANASIVGAGYQVLDTRTALLTRLPPTRTGEVPASLEGRTAKGIYFNVEKLKPFSVSP